jgi:hypothetical protein
MGNPTRKSGKKNRKFGRGLRSPAHKRYVAENRREKNKAKRAKKIAKILARKALRKANKNGSTD